MNFRKRGFETAALRLSEAVSRLAIRFGGLVMLATAGWLGVEILLRKLMNESTSGADELSSYALAISFSWALSFTVLKRSHIRIDVIVTRLGVRGRAYLDCLSILALSIYAITLTYFCVLVLLDTLELGARSNTTLGTPLWIPQSLWIAGFVLFSFTCILLTFSSFSSLLAGDHHRVRSLVGSRTIDKEYVTDSPSPSSNSGKR